MSGTKVISNSLDKYNELNQSFAPSLTTASTLTILEINGSGFLSDYLIYNNSSMCVSSKITVDDEIIFIARSNTSAGNGCLCQPITLSNANSQVDIQAFGLNASSYGNQTVSVVKPFPYIEDGYCSCVIPQPIYFEKKLKIEITPKDGTPVYPFINILGGTK